MSLNASDQQIDLRIRRTHKLLWEALLALLTEQDFESISVKDICERAMVHRTTFYKHYQDKYDLLWKGMSEMHKALINRTNQDYADDDSPYRFTDIFEHVAEHQHFYTLMLCGDGIASFQNLLCKHLAYCTEQKLQQLFQQKDPPAVPIALIAQFCSGAILNTTTWWLDNGMPCSTQEMSRYVTHLIMHGCQTVSEQPPLTTKQ